MPVRPINVHCIEASWLHLGGMHVQSNVLVPEQLLPSDLISHRGTATRQADFTGTQATVHRLSHTNSMAHLQQRLSRSAACCVHLPLHTTFAQACKLTLGHFSQLRKATCKRPLVPAWVKHQGL